METTSVRVQSQALVLVVRTSNSAVITLASSVRRLRLMPGNSVSWPVMSVFCQRNIYFGTCICNSSLR